MVANHGSCRQGKKKKLKKPSTYAIRHTERIIDARGNLKFANNALGMPCHLRLHQPRQPSQPSPLAHYYYSLHAQLPREDPSKHNHGRRKASWVESTFPTPTLMYIYVHTIDVCPAHVHRLLPSCSIFAVDTLTRTNEASTTRQMPFFPVPHDKRDALKL